MAYRRFVKWLNTDIDSAKKQKLRLDKKAVIKKLLKVENYFDNKITGIC